MRKVGSDWKGLKYEIGDVGPVGGVCSFDRTLGGDMIWKSFAARLRRG